MINNESQKLKFKRFIIQDNIMKCQLNSVFLLITFACLFSTTYGKDLLLHTIQYRLSSEKLLAIGTFKFNNNVQPAFMILEPEVQISQKQTFKQSPFVSQEQIEKQKKKLQAEIKNISKSQFHAKLPHPIKVLIHNQDEIQQQCMFDEPWDLCMIENPSKRNQLDYSIHCLLQEDQSGTKPGYCNGKFTIRQSDLTKITVDDSKYQQKIKYHSGLFELPQSEKHSVMLISCQDDDLPTFTDSLKIFSNSKYHRYERQNQEEIKELVGFDKTSTRKNISQNQQQNSQKNPESSPFEVIQMKERKFVYLDVKEQMVRKCLQFQFYATNNLINQRKVFDYVNLTDTEYKNIYSVIRKSLPTQNPKLEQQKNKSKTQNAQKQSIFKYNPQLTLDIFKPSHIRQNTSFGIRLKFINSLTHTTIVSYTIPLAMNKESLSLSTSLYSKSNHYHFCYVVGKEIIKGFSDVMVEVGFQARQSTNKQNHEMNLHQYFFVTLSIEDVQSVSVEKLATTYLSVKKSEHITFLLQQPYEIDQIKTQNNAKSTDLIQILPSLPGNMQITLSEHSSDHEHITQCHFSQGCKFQLDVIDDCLECKIDYKTSFIKSPNDMLMLEIKETIFQGKIDLDEIQYFYKELKPSEIVELIINTPNIIIYTLQNPQDLQKCKIPKKSCHSQVATSHERIILSNQDKLTNQVIFLAIEGLDKTRFSLLLVASDKIVNVMNGVPFTYKLPAQKNEIELLFEVPAFDESKPYQNNLTFNLISPLNSLQMDIIQLKDDGGELQAVQKSKTMSGFIKLSAKYVKTRKIKILLSKTTHYLSHPVHFTFIVSTSDHKFRLDTGITHYESMDSTEQKTFVIEFQDKHAYELNLHLYDTPKKQINFTVEVFNPNEVSEGKKTLTYNVDNKDWILVLDDDVVDEWDLCPENDPECTVFVTVKNMMTHEVELAVTLMTQDSVMELKDGVWQTFSVDDLLMRTHFYFNPTHSSNPVKIFFKSTNPEIFISAILYDNSQNVNPAEWPFPDTHNHKQEQNFQFNENYMFKSKHLIQLDNEDPEFKKCFPHCVVLMSIIESSEGKRQKKKQADSQHEGQFSTPFTTLSLLASNNHIELPQKLRLTLELKSSEQQLIYVDLKHAFKQKTQTLTFFTNMIVGYGQIYGKVYLPSLQNIPDQNDYDVIFGPVKTQISLMQIRDVFMQNIAWLVDVQSVEEVLEKEELYLALFIVAEEPTKMTLQYTTDYAEITDLSIDSTQTVSLSANQQKLFQFYPTRDEKIRFIRTKGYPLFHQFKCDAQEGGFDACLKGWLQRLRLNTEDDIRNIRREREMEKELLANSPKLTDKNMIEMAALSQEQQFSQYQILKKTQTQHVIECQQCIVFIWIYAMEESQLSIQLQSLSTETQVKENEMLTDYVEPNQYHRYYLARVQKEYTTIVVSVNEGSPVVAVGDNLNYNEVKKASEVKDDGKKVLLFTVPPAKQLPDKLSHASKNSFNNIFSNLHISITPEDAKPVSYTLSYSSGMHEMFLKNGVISTQYLFENENATFYYKNQNKSIKSYLTITVEASVEKIETILDGIEIKMFSLKMDASKGIVSKDELASQQPATPSTKFKKHTTLTYELPPVDDLQIDIFSQKTTKITIGLTGGQLVFLPMDYEYPIHLQPKQEVKFLVQNLDPGQDIEFILRKCDQSNPFIFYTLDQKQFQNNMYSNYDKFGSDSVYRHVIRAQNKKALYIKIKADPKEPSTLVIKSRYVIGGDDDFVDLDPGNMGLVEYQFESLSEVAVTFVGLQCGKECARMTEYYVVRGKSLDVLYKDMVCAGEQVVKLFERRQGKVDKKQSKAKGKNPEEILQNTNNIKPSSQSQPHITLELIPSSSTAQNTFHLTLPHLPELPILTIKAIYKPTGQQTYYKPIQIKTLKSSVSSYSSRLVMVFAGAVVIGILVLIVVTRKLARRGYVHVGQDETMVV